MINYVKVNVESEEVKVLSEKLNVPKSQIASMINNQRYRSMYNKQRNASMKELKQQVASLQQQLATKK